MEQEHLYMLAIMPPYELARDIANIRSEFAGKYHCKAALKPPVHITLIPPYKATADSEDMLAASLSDWGRLQIPFPVTLEDFGTFQKNGVIYINITSDKLLQLFQSDLERKFKTLLPHAVSGHHRPYHPHITIGYRDIPPQVFPAAAKEYLSKEFFATFVADRFYLWKHNGEKWEVLQTFTMGNL